MNPALRKILYYSMLAMALFLAGCGGGSVPVPVIPPPKGPAFAITSSAPPAGSIGASYAGNGFSLSASGGTAPYEWSWNGSQGSSLPSGLSLSPSGLISGIPQVAATYNIVVTVVDSSTPTLQVTSNYAITIAGTPVLTITSGSPPDGVVGVDYGPTITETFSCVWSPVLGWHEVCTPCTQTSCASLSPCRGFSAKPCEETVNLFQGFTFTAAGGVPPYSWSASGMPSGIDVDPSSGQVLGMPTTAGSYNVVVTVADASSPPGQVSGTDVINISSRAGKCVTRGGQCYAGHECCAGLQCIPASTRAFCE